jgi:AcrR family transcriptional regulator
LRLDRSLYKLAGVSPSATKSRIVHVTSGLFRRQGYHATGIKQIVEAANAPFGSIYHFFPGGKEEIGAQVIHSSGSMYLGLIEAILDSQPDVVAGARAFFEGAAAQLVATDYVDACPIATVALEVASTNDRLRQATDEVFELWIGASSDRFAAAGIDVARARELAVFALAALEGAFVISRAARDPEAVLAAGREVAVAVQAALPARRPRRPRHPSPTTRG